MEMLAMLGVFLMQWWIEDAWPFILNLFEKLFGGMNDKS